VANESSWDDGLPLRIDGYDPYGGIYQSGLNFEMYWDDNADKYERFVETLDQADYLLISSSRQWASTTRLPDRYPLTRAYYRHLMGCPPERSIEWCYNVAEVDRFQGDLGFDLVRIFVSNPRVGGLVINDQNFSSRTVFGSGTICSIRKIRAGNRTFISIAIGSL
jgi:hypothetical protein